MLYIYTKEVTKRLEYTLDFIFNGVLKINYELTTDIESCMLSQQAFINYSEKACGKSIHIPCNGLLSRTGTEALTLSVGLWDNLPILFDDFKGDIPFDLFSATFYLITRYEEYNSVHLDKHNRFDYKASIAWQNNFLTRPIVDEWILKFKDILLHYFPHLQIRTPEFKCISTIDVDHVYRFLGKSKIYMMAKVAAHIFKAEFTEARKIANVLLYRENDPYQQFSYLNDIHKGLKSKYILFMHVGPFGKYDRKNIYPLYSFYKYLRKENHSYIIGIHPSYKASFCAKRIKKEKSRLEKCLHYPITYNRNHYLRIQIPSSYRILNDLGIKHEYSLGYAGMYGFRAGTCHPFYFYDIEKDKTSKMKIHPNIVMDGTLNYYLKKNPEEAIAICNEMANICHSVNGEYVMLWHNNSLANMDEWKGWNTVFEKAIRYAASLAANIQR